MKQRIMDMKNELIVSMKRPHAWQLPKACVVHALSNILLNVVDGITQLLGNGMPAKTFYIEVIGFCWEN